MGVKNFFYVGVKNFYVGVKQDTPFDISYHFPARVDVRPTSAGIIAKVKNDDRKVRACALDSGAS